MTPRSLCIRCGADKELPLGRCAQCAHVPDRGEAALSLLASTRMLSAEELDTVQGRLQRGEALRPSHARLRRARSLLIGGSEAAEPLSRRQLTALAALSIVLTPIPALLAAWAWRETGRSRPCLTIAAVAGTIDGSLWLLVLR